MIQTEIFAPGRIEIDDGVNYRCYQELGGIINESDYNKALERASRTFSLDRHLVGQAEGIARVSGISLKSFGVIMDGITLLYGVLRTDSNPKVEYHHSRMSDQRLFAEALRMLNRPDLLEKVVKAYPNISFT